MRRQNVARPASAVLVFGAVAGRAHLHELRIELAEDFDQIGLRGHDGVDVLTDTRHFIEAGAEQLDTALGEQLLGRAPGEGRHRRRAAHHATRANPCRAQRNRATPSSRE